MKKLFIALLIGIPLMGWGAATVTVDSDVLVNPTASELETANPTLDDQTASEVSITPAGDIEATDAQAAIEELDAEKSPIGSTQYFENLDVLASAMQGLTGTRILPVGDSYSNDFGFDTLAAFTEPLTQRNKTWHWAHFTSLTGGAASVGATSVTEFSGQRLWVNNILRLPDGATAQITANGFDFEAAGPLEVLVLNHTGGGTLTFEFSVNGGSTWTAAGTGNSYDSSGTTSYALHAADYSGIYKKFRSKVRWRVTSSGGVGLIAEAGITRGRPGYVQQVVGSPADSGWEWETTAFPAGLFQSAIDALNVDVVVNASAEAASSYASDGVLQDLLDEALAANSDLVWIEAGRFYFDPAVTATSQQTDDIVAQREFCLRNNQVYWDRLAFMGDYAVAKSKGYLVDGDVHLQTPGDYATRRLARTTLLPIFAGWSNHQGVISPTDLNRTDYYGGIIHGSLSLVPAAQNRTAHLFFYDANATAENDAYAIWNEDNQLVMGISPNTGGEFKRVGMGINGSFFGPLADGGQYTDLGQAAEPWDEAFLSNHISFEGATDDAFETVLTVTEPTADATVTLPNVTGTVGTYIVKTDTGDPGTVVEGQMVLNTFDDTLKIGMEGAWVTIVADTTP